jgi:hypothetical protein
MLKRILAVAALAGAAAMTTPASAEVLCGSVYVAVNDTVVDQTACTPV